MSKYAVAVFPNEPAAYEGVGAFNSLHAEGNISLYGLAVIAKDAGGNASVKEEQDQGPVGTALGMLSGALIGAIAGPAGMALGMAGGGMVGSLVDVNDAGVGLDFLELVGNKMDAGTVAIVTEIDEYWSTPLDSRIENLGGEVYRRTRADFEDEQFAQEVKAWNDELDALDAEMQAASDEMQASLQAKKDAVRQSLKEAQEKGNKKINQLDNELNAKIAKLEKQSSEAKAEAKAKIDKTLADVKAGYKARIAKLKEASSLIKEALS